MKNRILRCLPACVLLIFIIAISCMNAFSGENEGKSGTFQLNGLTIEGYYSIKEDGAIEILTPEDPHIERILCKLKNNKLSDNASILYKNGDIQTGVLKNGKWKGTTTLTTSGGIVEKTYYSKGIPTGRMTKQTKNGEIKQDWYYDGILISERIESASEYATDTYYYKNFSLSDEMVKVKGVIENIFESETEFVLKLVSDDDGIYYVRYQNGIYDKNAPAIVPRLKIGQNICVFGLFKGIHISNYMGDDPNSYGFSFPHIDAIYVEKSGEDIDIFAVPDKPYLYDDILENPYCYVNSKLELKGSVLGIKVDGADYYCKLKSINDNIYYIRIAKKIIDGRLPIPNDEITIKGKLYGNYCETYTNETGKNKTTVYPFIDNAVIEKYY